MQERRYGAFAIFTEDRYLLTFIRAADESQLAARLGWWVGGQAVVMLGELPGGEKVIAEELPDELDEELAHAGLLRKNSPTAITAVTNPQLSEWFPERRIFTLTVYEHAQQAAEAIAGATTEAA